MGLEVMALNFRNIAYFQEVQKYYVLESRYIFIKNQRKSFVFEKTMRSTVQRQLEYWICWNVFYFFVTCFYVHFYCQKLLIIILILLGHIFGSQ